MAMLWSVFCLALLGGAFDPAIKPLVKHANAKIATLPSQKIQQQKPGTSCKLYIMNKSWVATSAECQVSYKNVVLGEEFYASKYDPSQVKRISKIINHPDYNPLTSANDIALIKLSSPITFPGQVSPVRLSSSSDLFNGGEECFTTGCKNINADTQSTRPELQRADLPILTNSDCSIHEGSGILETMLCAAASGVSFCVADPGETLVCKKNGANIESWASSTSSTSILDVYTRISAFRDWIEKTIANN